MGVVLPIRARRRAAGMGALAFTPDDQLAAAQSAGDQADAERKARNEKARQVIKRYGEAVTAVFPAAAPFAAAALLCFEGAIKLSNMVSDDQNSPADKQRCVDALARYSAIQIIPAAFQPEQWNGAKQYAHVLEAGLAGYDALSVEEQAQVREVGAMFGRHGDQPLLYKEFDALARGWGMVYGTIEYSAQFDAYYGIARVIGMAAAIEFNADMDAVVATARLTWQEWMRELVRLDSGIDATRAHWRAIAATGVAAIAKAREIGTPRPYTMASSRGVVSAFDRAAAAGLTETVLRGPSEPTPIPAATVAIGAGVVAGAAWFVLKSAAGSFIRRALGL